MSTTTINCTYSNPHALVNIGSGRLFVGPMPVSSTVSTTQISAVYPFNFASSTCIETSDGGGGSVSVDLAPLTASLTLGLSTLIFLAILSMAFIFTQKK